MSDPDSILRRIRACRDLRHRWQPALVQKLTILLRQTIGMRSVSAGAVPCLQTCFGNL